MAGGKFQERFIVNAKNIGSYIAKYLEEHGVPDYGGDIPNPGDEGTGGYVTLEDLDIVLDSFFTRAVNITGTSLPTENNYYGKTVAIKDNPVIPDGMYVYNGNSWIQQVLL